MDAVDGPGASHGARLIVRGNEKTDTFYTVGLWASGREVRIEKSRGLAFETMTNNQCGALAAAPFPVELGKTYELTVVADHATIYCYIDGKFVVLAQEPDFTTQPAGRVGFFTNGATATFSDVSVKGLKNVTSSPVTPYAGNPVNLTNYSPAVIKDDKFRMWDSLLGRYAESVDGILWTWPVGKESVVNRGNTGDWPTGNQCGDPDVLKFNGQYWITYWSTCNRRNGAFDGMGIKRSPDGIHWTPEPANPVFYMGPLGDWDETGGGRSRDDPRRRSLQAVARRHHTLAAGLPERIRLRREPRRPPLAQVPPEPDSDPGQAGNLGRRLDLCGGGREDRRRAVRHARLQGQARRQLSSLLHRPTHQQRD